MGSGDSTTPPDEWPVAGLLPRLAAMVYDVLLVLALLLLAGALALLALGGNAPPTGASWYTLYLVGVVYLFFAGFWVRRGQTLGMRSWRLRLRRRSGGPPTLLDASLRFAAASLSLAAAGLGFAWQIVDRDGLSWHDRLSGTVIRRAPKPN